MVGFLDIAPVKQYVMGVEVTGVTAEGIAVLMVDHPELADVITDFANMSAASLARLAPQAIASIIAAGVGYPGNKEYIAQAKKLTLGPQLDFLEKIIALTMPGGLGPFVERLTGLFGMVTQSVPSPSAESTGKAPATT